ncbi:hypothetical protein B0J14DRAFT_486530 [Halenospora varia]|nr:hypothetical protein B0J14DRAFT_486530 [Halenospora varia]
MSSAITNNHTSYDCNHKPKHSKQPYTQEQVDWIRYKRDDCRWTWPSIRQKFPLYFTGVRGTVQCFSSRYYRDNRVPKVDGNWNLVTGEDGRPIYNLERVRERDTPDGRARDVPYRLVDKHPQRALEYSWVSEEHKHEAQRILQGGDRESSK